MSESVKNEIVLKRMLKFFMLKFFYFQNITNSIRENRIHIHKVRGRQKQMSVELNFLGHVPVFPRLNSPSLNQSNPSTSCICIYGKRYHCANKGIYNLYYFFLTK